jgi:ABC-type transport system involved in cytochrome bd biosynthesis fused ATPase/permease subunit
VGLRRDRDLVVSDVTFAYGDGAPAVADASLTVHAGEQFALVGATGAGKSTLAKLLDRAYDALCAPVGQLAGRRGRLTRYSAPGRTRPVS